MKNIFLFTVIVFLTSSVKAQNPAPVGAQSEPIIIMNATAHLGNGQVIDNAAIAFENGKLTLVADARTIKLDMSKFKKVINAFGKHVYPGLIECNSTLGLTELDAARATSDNYEVGDNNADVRSIIAYNTDSKIIPTVRSNGVLLAQVVPQGGTI